MDRLSGDAGTDELVGGPSFDWLDAGTGDDRVDADDGTQDRVECAEGQDTETLDELDFFANHSFSHYQDLTCEHVIRSGPAGLLYLRPVDVVLTRRSPSRAETYYNVVCPPDAPHCEGTFSLVWQGRTLFTHSLSVERGVQSGYSAAIPIEILDTVPRTDFRATVAVSYSDQAGGLIEHRAPARVRVQDDTTR